TLGTRPPAPRRCWPPPRRGGPAGAGCGRSSRACPVRRRRPQCGAAWSWSVSRQGEEDLRPGARTDADPATVGLDDALSNRHAQAGAFRLGRVERLEDPPPLLGTQARPVVLNRDEN